MDTKSINNKPIEDQIDPNITRRTETLKTSMKFRKLLNEVNSELKAREVLKVPLTFEKIIELLGTKINTFKMTDK